MKQDNKTYLLEMGFSEKAIDLISRKANIGRIANPSAYAKLHGSGDVMELHLKVISGVIEDAKYLLSGYAGLLASGSGLTEMVKGLKVDEALKIEVEDIVNFVGSIPESKYSCAELARDTLRAAIKNLG